MSDDLCIDCKRDMARYCQSCMAKYLSENTRQREIIGELQTAIEKMRAMLPKEATATESLMFQSGLLEALARSRKAIGESK